MAGISRNVASRVALAAPKQRLLLQIDALMLNDTDYSESEQSAYRAYHIGESGKVQFAVPIEAGSDGQAIAQAREMVDGHVLELWDRGRLILTLPSRD